VRAICKLSGNKSSAHELGLDIGDTETRNAQFLETARIVAFGRNEIGIVGDSATELILPRRCRDVCKVTHHLRAHGTKLHAATFERFDKELEKALALVTGGPLHAEALLQARLGTRQGGIGARSASDVLLPAFLASTV